MAPSRIGPRNGASGLNTFSQVILSRTPTTRGSTGQFATNGYPSITGPALKRFRTSPLNGCGPTLTTARIWPSAASPQSSIWPRLHKRSTFRFSGNWGDYLSSHHPRGVAPIFLPYQQLYSDQIWRDPELSATALLRQKIELLPVLFGPYISVMGLNSIRVRRSIAWKFFNSRAVILVTHYFPASRARKMLSQPSF